MIHVPPAALVGLGSTLAFMALVWLVSLVRRDVSTVDVAWGPAFVVLAWAERAALGATSPRAWLVCLLVTAWGARLALHIALRNRGRGEDPRYAAMRARSPRTFAWSSLVTVFALQSVLAWVIALPIHAALRPAETTASGPLDVAGVALWCVGFAFESIGDAQLARFKARPENRGKVMDQGLWRFTRHPNYFGEALMWWGLGVVALATPGGVWALTGPALLTFLLLRVSGVTLLEAHLSEKRPQYRDYVARTSAFLPWPPRR